MSGLVADREPFGEMCGKVIMLRDRDSEQELPYSCMHLKRHKGPHRTYYDWFNEEDPEIS